MSTAHRPKQSVTARHLHKRGVQGLVRVLSSRVSGDVPVYSLQVHDGYDTRRYSLERMLFYHSAAAMNRYLAKRQHLNFEHRRNVVRHALYSLPSFSKWANLMDSQGSLAMEPLHNPEVRRLASGDKLGPVTRRLFRHGSDPVGIRSRTITAGWLAQQYVGSHPGDIKWLSLAGGSAIHAMFMVDASGVEKSRLTYVDIDINPTAIELAGHATALAGLEADHTRLLAGDVFDKQLIAEAGCAAGVDIIDMMGILEYLDEHQASRLIKLAYDRLTPGGILLTCNMRRAHPQLDLHKRGVGWPGVIPRSVADVQAVVHAAGIPGRLTAYQPSDGVYNVYCITKETHAS